jgi:hypothetical protein
MKKLGLTLISLLTASLVLVSCGGGGDAPATIASSNLTTAVAASNVAAVTGESFTFSSGVTSFGTASATTVTLNSTSTFSVTATEGTATGNLSFGSCIFTVTGSNFPVGSPLALGATVTVHPCTLTIATAGVSSTENAVARAVSFVLAGNASVAKNLEVDISDSGVVTVEGVSVGTVTLQAATGGS